MVGKQMRLTLAVAGILLLAACQSSESPTPAPETGADEPTTPEPPAPKTGVDEPAIDECFRSASVEVYADVDADGQRDEGEPPLEGIDIGLLELGDSPSVISQDETDADGRADVGFILSGGDCDLDGYVIGPLVVPSGYEYPPNPLADFGEVWESHETLQIGLLVDATVTDATIPTIPEPTPFVNPCQLVTAADFERMVGPLSEAPIEAIESPGRLGRGQQCIFHTATQSFVLSLTAYATAGEALEQYEGLRIPSEAAEDIPDLGDAAFWMPVIGINDFMLAVVQDTSVIRIDGDDREGMIEMARLAVARLSGDLPMPTAAAVPTQAPTPDFDPCDSLTREEAESLIGGLTQEPEFSSVVGEDAGNLVGCTYQSASGFIWIFYIHSVSAERAQELLTDSGIGDDEVIAGLGDASRWNEKGLTLCATRGNLYLCINGLAREGAIEAMGIVLARVPY
jgi:hypothetical protein